MMAARTSLPATPRSRCPDSSRSRKARKWSTSRRRVRRARPPGRSAPFDVRSTLIQGPERPGPLFFKDRGERLDGQTELRVPETPARAGQEAEEGRKEEAEGSRPRRRKSGAGTQRGNGPKGSRSLTAPKAPGS